MKSFDDWYKEANKIKDDGFTNRDFYEAGQQSRQGEVDQLKLINFDSELNLDAAKEQIDILNKRIELALFELEQLHLLKTSNSNNAIKFLKGEKNENN